jgi:hypothetical protein
MAALPAQRNNRKQRTRFRRLGRPRQANLNPSNPTKRSLRRPTTEGLEQSAPTVGISSLYEESLFEGNRRIRHFHRRQENHPLNFKINCLS